MDVLDFIKRKGVETIPNPNYNPKSKKNKQPATFTVNVVDPVLPSLVVYPSVVNVNVDNESEVKVTLEGKEVMEDVSYISDDDCVWVLPGFTMEAGPLI